MALCQQLRARPKKMQMQDFTYDPFSLEAMINPLPLYRQLRERFPIYPLPQYDGYAVSRFQDVWDTFLDREHFSEAEGQVFMKEAVSKSWGGPPTPNPVDPVGPFLFIEAPHHMNLRRALHGPLLQAPILRMEPFIREITRRKLDELCAQGSFDINSDYASQISSTAICHICGVPATEVSRIVHLVNSAMTREPGRPGVTEAGFAAMGELRGMMIEFVRLRREGKMPEPCPLLEGLFASEAMGHRLSDEEIADQVMSLVVGGTESLPKVISGGLLELRNRPDQLAAVLEDPAGRSASVVEEMIRYCAPAQWFGRTLKCDLTVAGQPMRAGQRVFVLVASANRDEREFENPDDFRWDRKMKRVVAFGIGPHFCIGIHLARLEARIMVEELLKRVPGYELDMDNAKKSISEFQIGWTKLPLIVN